MITVVLYGITGGRVADEIKRILSHYGIISVRGTNIEEVKKEPEFLIIECTTSANINAQKGIIVMTGETSESFQLKLPQTYKGIVFSNDTLALKKLSDNKITTVTCGMSNKDTMVLSSVTDNTASVCLQRKIITLSGNEVEPCEFPVKLKTPITDYALLASFAILLLSDIKPHGGEY